MGDAEPMDIHHQAYQTTFTGGMNGGVWCDPFAGRNSPAQITNDLDPKINTTYHLEALEFLKQQPSILRRGRPVRRRMERA
jgi:hypothetical protein